jgi:O-antigen ligase
MSGATPIQRSATERGVSMALATVLALLPLLPTGPEYLGLPAGAWVEAGVLLLALVALVSLLLERGRQHTTGGAMPAVGWGWLAFLAAVLGAAFVGLVSENKILTPVFLAYLRELAADLLPPMDQATHPLYPVRAALAFLEGFLAFLLVWWTCQRAADPKRRAWTALTGWLLGFVVTAGFAVFQYLTRFRLHPYWVEVNPNLTRSHSTLDDPNALGSYMVFGIGIALGLLLGWSQLRSRPAAKWITMMAWILGPLALLATVSRSSWAVLPLAIVLYVASPLPLPSFIASRLSWARRSARAALVLLLVFVAIWAAAKAWVPDRPGYKPASMTEAMIATLDPRVPMQDVLEGRFIWWTAGSRMFLEHPIAGVGLGRFPRLLPHYQSERQVYENAHNLYLQVAAVMGVVGLLAFLFFLASLAATLHAAVSQPDVAEEGRALAAGVILGTLALLLTCITGHPLLLPSMQLLFATGLAVSLVAIGTASHSRVRHWGLSALLIALVALPVYAVAAYQASEAARPGGPWGYAWGVHAHEVDAGGFDFRWTGPEASFYFVPPEGAELLELIYTAAHPIRDGVPTEVWIQLGDETHSDYRQDDRWTRILIPLPEEVIRGQRKGILLTVRVDPPLLPANVWLSDDDRQLGLMLRPPRFRPGQR